MRAATRICCQLRPRARYLCASAEGLGRTLAPRLKPYAPAIGLTDEQRIVYDRILEEDAERRCNTSDAECICQLGPCSLVGPWNAMVASPTIGGLLDRMGSFCRNRNTCPADLYEVGILVVGVEWQSQFEWYAHEKLALKAGVLPEAIQGIKQSLPPSEIVGMTDAQRAVYAYARQLHDKKRISDKLHNAALSAVGGEQALVDLVFTMGFYHQISMTLNAFNVPLPPGEPLQFPEPEP